MGWVPQHESELIRHADPAGRSLGQFFADEVAKPLGLDFHIGLPASVDRDRVAHLHCWSHAEMMLHLNVLPMCFVVATFNPRSLTLRAVTIPKGLKTFDDCNRDDYRAVEIPASNGIGTARSVAKAYGSVATGGSDLGITPSTLDALTQPATPPTNGMRDKVMHVDTVFSLGYMKPFPTFQFGSSSKAFGTPGLGGSFAHRLDLMLASSRRQAAILAEATPVRSQSAVASFALILRQRNQPDDVALQTFPAPSSSPNPLGVSFGTKVSCVWTRRRTAYGHPIPHRPSSVP